MCNKGGSFAPNENKLKKVITAAMSELAQSPTVGLPLIGDCVERPRNWCSQTPDSSVVGRALTILKFAVLSILDYCEKVGD